MRNNHDHFQEGSGLDYQNDRDLTDDEEIFVRTGEIISGNTILVVDYNIIYTNIIYYILL